MKILSFTAFFIQLTSITPISAFVTNGGVKNAVISSERKTAGRNPNYLVVGKNPNDLDNKDTLRRNELSWSLYAHDKNKNTFPPLESSFFPTLVCSLFLNLFLTFSALPPSEYAFANDFDSLSVEQKAAAEAWKVVDFSALDRTFNGQDWYQTRQSIVKKKYRNMEEVQSSIETMVATLGDKYTRYLSPAKYQSIIDSATGTLAGVGVEISKNKDGYVIAADVEPSSPAFAAGIQPDDVFSEVDGVKFDEDTKSTPDDVATRLRGPEGTRVGVTVKRDGKTFDYIVTRKAIKITTVKNYISDVPNVGKVGVIRIKSFSSTTAATVEEQYDQLMKKGGLKALVVDVRGNPGGLLPGGVDTAALFLDDNKPIVFVVDKKGVIAAQSSIKRGIDVDTPLIILVDGNTASAAEVFTAALKENKRATIAGEQTFGKGVIQTIRELSNGNGGIAITVARYETPNRNNINKSGIPVDLTTSTDCKKNDATACLTREVFKF